MPENKRLGIFVFFDREGIVDDYVIYLLNDLRKNLDRLVIVCNGRLTPEGRAQFSEMTPDLYVRENEGYDAGAYKFALEEYLGWDTVNEYDELVLCNDTFYGPFRPFSGCFAQMDSDHPDADFWGMTVFSRANDQWTDRPLGYLPEHIQSYFLVIRKAMLHCPEFRSFWKGMDTEAHAVIDIIENFETAFTPYFAGRGFKWAVCCDTRDRDNTKDHVNIINHTVYDCYTLVRDYDCPLIKRRAFTWPDHLEANDGGNAARALEYIRNNTDYDVSMIYRHLLRISNITLLKQNLAWNYVLPTDVRLSDESVPVGKALVVIHQFYPELIDEMESYVREIPEEFDLLVTTSNPDPTMAEEIEKRYSACRCRFLGVMRAPARGRDMAGFLCCARETMQKYEYVCFTHDKKTNAAALFATVGDNFRDLILKNVLGSGIYMENIIRTFEKDPCLGVLVPPVPYHGPYINAYTRGWQDNFENCRKVLKMLGTDVPMDRDLMPYAVGTSLWFRTAALKPLLGHSFTPEFFPAEPMPADGTISHGLERAFPYIAQSLGYYTGWAMTPAYAALYTEQFGHMFSTMASEVTKYINLGDPVPAFRQINLELLAAVTAHTSTAGPASQNGMPVQAPGENIRSALFGGKEDIMLASDIALVRDADRLPEVGLNSALSLLWITKDIRRKKRSRRYSLRKQAEYFNAAVALPKVSDARWLVRKTFRNWIRKPLGFKLFSYSILRKRK